jgi:hypothetical protein
VEEEVVKNLEIPTPYEQLESFTKTNIVLRAGSIGFYSIGFYSVFK